MTKEKRDFGLAIRTILQIEQIIKNLTFVKEDIANLETLLLELVESIRKMEKQRPNKGRK